MNKGNISIVETDTATYITVPKTTPLHTDNTESMSFSDLTGALANDPELKGKTALEVEDYAHQLWQQAMDKERDDLTTS